MFVSSHLISEMALTADQLVVIGQGRLLADTSVAELSARSASLEEAFFELTRGSTEYRGEHWTPTGGRHDDHRGNPRPTAATASRRRPGWNGSSCAACARPGGSWPPPSPARSASPSPSASTPGTRTGDLTNNALAGVVPGLLLIGVLGVLAMTGEYSSGMIRATLAAVPRPAAGAGRQGGGVRGGGAGGRGGRGVHRVLRRGGRAAGTASRRPRSASPACCGRSC